MKDDRIALTVNVSNFTNTWEKNSNQFRLFLCKLWIPLKMAQLYELLQQEKLTKLCGMLFVTIFLLNGISFKFCKCYTLSHFFSYVKN